MYAFAPTIRNFEMMLKASLSGIFTGILLSIPIGPAGFEAVKRTISKGYKEGFLVSLGAVSADTLDIILINFGIFNLLDSSSKSQGVFWIISGVILSIMGFMSIKKDKMGKESHEINLKSSNLKSMPYISGFLIVLSNPMNHSLWITMSGTVMRLWQESSTAAYYTFIISLIVGMIAWFALLNLLALKGNKKISLDSSQWISKALMWCILIFGIGFIFYGLYRLLV